MTKKNDEFLVGQGDLMKVLSIGRPVFHALIEAGMPGRFHNNRWYFHLDNVNAWLKQWTAVSVGQVFDEEEETITQKGERS